MIYGPEDARIFESDRRKTFQAFLLSLFCLLGFHAIATWVAGPEIFSRAKRWGFTVGVYPFRKISGCGIFGILEPRGLDSFPHAECEANARRV